MSILNIPYHLFSIPLRKLGQGDNSRLSIMIVFMTTISMAFIILLTSQGIEPFTMIILALLGVIGMFCLFASAMGLIHFGETHDNDILATVHTDCLHEGVMITARDGTVKYVNRAYFQIFEIQQGRDIPSPEYLLTGNILISENLFRLVKAMHQGQFAQEEFRLSGTFGEAQNDDHDTPKWLRITVSPLLHNEQQDQYENQQDYEDLMVWRVAEITHERQRQDKTFQHFQQAIEYFDHAPAGFFSTDMTGHIDYMNATLARWLELDLADVITGEMTASNIVSEDSWALLSSQASETTDKSSQGLDIDLIKADSKRLPAHLFHQFTPIDGESKQIRAMVLNRSPEIRQFNQEESIEVRFGGFFNAAPIAISTVDLKGNIGNPNAAFARMFNGSRKTLIKSGVSIFDIIAEHDRESLEEALAKARERQIDIVPVEFTFGSAGDRNGRFYVSPVEYSDGGSEVAILYSIETTEQKALEIQIAQSQKMQAVGQLAGGIAHDFNNVLTAIIGFSDLLLANHRPTDPAFKDIMNIKQNANRAAGLVRQLLAFSRQQTLRPAVLTLTDVISDLQVLLSRLLGENVSLKVIHGRDLWFVKADSTQFEQVIINLAVNARDAMKGGGQLTISTENISAKESSKYANGAIEPAEYVMCEVTDTGSGISEDYIEKVFDPFFSTKEIGKGTGLGLSTVYGIVKQTGGYIYPESEVGKGTVFRIFLPRHVEDMQAATIAAVSERSEKRDKPGDLTGTGSILLVEDEEAVRSFAARALSSRGYHILEASSGIEALNIMKDQDGAVDLVVSDVVMPEMDGPTLLKQLRKTNPDLKIIFVSGYAEDAFKKNLEEDESFAFLPKPFSLKELARAVKDTLQGSP